MKTKKQIQRRIKQLEKQCNDAVMDWSQSDKVDSIFGKITALKWALR